MQDFFSTFKYKWTGYVKILLLLLVIGVFVYGVIYIYTPYKPNGFDLASVQSENNDLSITETSDYFSIIPKSLSSSKISSAYIFYPGGRVAPESYLRHWALISQKQNIASFILKSPFNFAILNTNQTDKVLEDYSSLKEIYIGGHSLGGVAASSYVSSNSTNSKIHGLFLWASYPADSSLQTSTIPIISIYGSKDGFVTDQKIEDSKSKLPSKTKFIKIEGMNHSEFGDYGLQSRDNKPSISYQKAREEIESKMGF